MTTLNKPVARVTQDSYGTLKFSDPRPIVCSMLVGDVLEFREKGKRGRWSIPIDAAFRFAVTCQAEKERRDKGAGKKPRITRSKL